MATIRPTGYLAHYGFSEEDVLEHYGVKGMKWGKHLKAKITQLSDQYITGKSAKEEYQNASSDAYLNAIKKAAAESNRQVYLKDQERNTDQSERYSKAAEKSLNAAAKSSMKANSAKNEYTKLYKESLPGMNLTKKIQEYAPKLAAASKSYKDNSYDARSKVGDAKYFSAAAKDSEKAANASKQKAANTAKKVQGYMNAMHAANAKAHSAKLKYDKTAAAKIEKSKKKIMKFFGRG